MFPITSFHPMSMGFPFAGQQQQQQQQQPPPSIYQSQYGGFQQQIPTAFTQAPPPPVQPYSQPGGPYISGPTPLSPRRNQYPPPPPAPSQHYEYRRNHRSKSHQKQHKRRSVSPRGAAEQSLYSDRERAETVEKQEDRSASQSPALVNSDSKSEEGEGADHPHVENVSDEVGQGDAASAEEGKKIEGDHKRKSKSKKKKHQRAEHERYLSPPNQRGAFYNGGRNGFSSPSKNPYPSVYGQQTNGAPRIPQPNDLSQYPYGPPSGYPGQPFNAVRPPFNPFPSYVGGPPNYFGQPPAPGNPFNTRPPWAQQGGANGPAEQEIQRLRSHIHSLESELHKLQKKLSKSAVQNREHSGQEESHDEQRKSKRDTAGSPRQTPVIVELNNAEHDTRRTTKSKKHQNRTASPQGSQQDATFRARSPSPVQHPRESEERSRGPHVADVQQNRSAGAYQQPYHLNSNYNQSNNNDFVDHRQQHDKQNLSAEKVLDAFERFYVNRGGSSAAPMKVKFIPEDSSTAFHQRNTNNNNQNRSTSERSWASPCSHSERLSSRRHDQRTTAPLTDRR